VEWTLHFRNTGKTDTPILSDIQALDATFYRSDDGEFALHYNTGDNCSPESYAPHMEVMGRNVVKQFAPVGGRPTNGSYPYFNVEMPGGGVIAVVGWPGQWSAQFRRDGGKALQIRAGQELTHFKLHPGEEVRSPLIVLQFHDGDWIRGQNIWRRWMVAHNLPRPGGKLVPTHYAACFGNLQPKAEEECAAIDGYAREGIGLDYWILDAGWYEDRGGWWDTGTWEIDGDRFPNGLREVADRAHANGMGFVVWFEPQRCAAGSWLAENHREWVLGGTEGGLVNLGDPDAREWVTDMVDRTMKKERIDVYRQDFNIDPLGYWRANDAEDRQGITEIRDVTGYLAFWDELLRRDPKRWIDSCASGGRRNDLETMRRSVPLLRSDCWEGAVTQQCQTYGLSFWLPYHGSGTGMTDEYMFRSCIFPASRVGCDTRKLDEDYLLLKRMIAEFRKVQPYLLCDYYPLTPYSLEKSVWMAWQFGSPEQGEGFVQAFRRDDCTDESRTLKLCCLDRDAVYTMENLDTGASLKIPGRELIDEGLRVEIAERPGSALIAYRRSLPDPSDRPTLTFENPEVQAVNGEAYARALDNLLRINVLDAGPKQMRSGLVADPLGTFLRAGGDYQEPLTRDASVNSWNALGLLAPDLARNTLWAVCERRADGGLCIQNDNQWWDKVIWVIAAWNHYATTHLRAIPAIGVCGANTVDDAR
jgi:alpha-galactosidase